MMRIYTGSFENIFEKIQKLKLGWRIMSYAKVSNNIIDC